MLPSLLLAAATLSPAAPVPPGASASLPAGVAPVPMYLKADQTGQVWVFGSVTQVVTINQAFVVNENGKQVVKQEPRQITQNVSMKTSLADLKATFATVGGTDLTSADAVNRVRNGAVLFVSGDGKPVPKGWLRGLSEDTIVVTTDALKNLKLYHGAANQATTPAPRLVMLAAGEDGKVMVETNPNAGNNADPFSNRVIVNGVVQAPTGAATSMKPLDEVKFDAFDLSGKMVPRADAVKRLKNGGLAVIAGDHRLPDDSYLKAFGDADLLVLAASELVLPTPTTAVQRALPVPAAAPAVAPALPAVGVKVNAAAAVRVAPAPVVAKPAVKVEAVKPAPVKPPEKP